MLEIFIWLAVYTVVILLFVPLEKIGHAQTSVKKWVQQLKDKANK